MNSYFWLSAIHPSYEFDVHVGYQLETNWDAPPSCSSYAQPSYVIFPMNARSLDR